MDLEIRSLGLLLSQLYATRHLIEGVIRNLEETAGLIPPPGPSMPMDDCPHPPERQVNATVMGGPPMVVCLVCGQQRLGTVE